MSANSLKHKATFKEYLMKYVTVSLSIYKITHRSQQQFIGSAMGNSQEKKINHPQRQVGRRVGWSENSERFIYRSADYCVEKIDLTVKGAAAYKDPRTYTRAHLHQLCSSALSFLMINMFRRLSAPTQLPAKFLEGQQYGPWTNAVRRKNKVHPDLCYHLRKVHGPKGSIPLLHCAFYHMHK